MVKNLPVNARDTDSFPGTGKSHMLQSSWAHAPKYWAWALEPGRCSCGGLSSLELALCNRGGHCSEKPVYHNKEWPPLTVNWMSSNKDPAQPKINKIIFLSAENQWNREQKNIRGKNHWNQDCATENNGKLLIWLFRKKGQDTHYQYKQ